jgi:ubiquinone/menaquinone biosynthesis C-methylase UbiE
MDKNINNEKTWDEIASQWNKYRVKTSPTVLNFLKDKKGKVLDLGCGSGRNFISLSGLEWYATDISKEMIKYAKKTAEEKRIEVELRKADSSNIPYKDAFFDAVICYAVLHCIESKDKRQKTLKEIHRVLKSGGQALISSWGKKSPRLRSKEKECFVPWTTKENDRTERYTYIFDLEELKELAEEVGFEIISAWEERNVNLIVRKK